MRASSLTTSILALVTAACSSGWAADAVTVTPVGNTVFSGDVAIGGSLTSAGPVGAPNVLVGSPGVTIAASAALTTTAFGQWHWIAGTASNYTVTLPSAAGNAGKCIGFHVRDAGFASKAYTIAAAGAEKIDGAATRLLLANMTLILVSDGTSWACTSGTQGDMPAGTIVAFAGMTPPTGWVSCDGTAYSRSTYTALFAAIGTVWGAGDGSTTFQVPNFQRRTLIGAGGTVISSLVGNTVGSSGGEEMHTQTIAEMPAHTHSESTSLNNNDKVSPGTTHSVNSGVGAATTGAAGGGAPFNVMQPSAVVNYIIKL